VDVDILIEAIHRQRASLPPSASKIKMVRTVYELKTNQIQTPYSHLKSFQQFLYFRQIILKIAYDCVSKVYLECLMKTKFRMLEKLWGNVKDKIKEDAQHLHKKFSALVNSFFFLHCCSTSDHSLSVTLCLVSISLKPLLP